MNIIDILLIFVLIFLIYNIVNNRNYTKIDANDNFLSNNIIFDDDITIINTPQSNEKQLKDESSFIGQKEHFEDKKEVSPQNNTNNTANTNNTVNTNNNLKYKELYSKQNINKTINEIIDIPKKTLDKELKDNKFYLSNDYDSNKLDDVFIPKNEARENNRYNRKYNNIPTELELYNIQKYNLKHSNFSNDAILSNVDQTKNLNSNNNYINMNYVNEIVNNKNKNDIDTKIFNKTNKSQKLYKDAKTIAGRFTKDSIINDYKYELDYYQKLRTPWWEENVE